MCSDTSSTAASETLNDSGGSGGNYQNNEDCLFVISPTGATSITLSFSAFNLETNFDFLRIYDGNSVTDPLIANLNGTTVPGSVTSTGGSMLVRFTSDFSVTRSGFVASWTSNGGGGGTCDTFFDNFNTASYANQNGTASWSTDWIETGDNNNSANGDIQINNNRLELEGDGSGGGRAAFGGEPSIEREANLSAYSTATLSFDYSETGTWESNDDIEVWVSSDGGSNWTLIQTFTNDQGSATQTFSQDISSSISANTRIAFVEKASVGSEIFRIDNVQIEGCSSTGGATCDVADSFSNVSYSQNDGVDNWAGDWIEVAESDGPSAGIARVRNDNCSAGNCLRLGVPGGLSAQTYSGIGVRREVDLNGVSAADLTFNYFTGFGGGTASVDLWVSDDGGSSWNLLQTYNITGTSFTATAQSFDISAYASSNTQIRFTADGTSAVSGFYVDDISIDYPCPKIPVAEWQLEEAVWTGSAGEVLDSSGNGHNGTAVNGAVNTVTSPAIPGDPGTCRYSDFGASAQEHVEVPYSAQINPDGDFTVTLWVRVDGGQGTYRSPVTSRWQNAGFSQRRGYNIYASDSNNWQFWTGNGGAGWDIVDGPAVSLGQWTHLAITFASSSNVGSTHTGIKKIYVNGSATVANSRIYYPNQDFPTTIGAGQNNVGFSNDWFFDGAIDEVRIYDEALSDSEVTQVMAETRPCPVIGPDHYQITHSGQGITCEAEPITITAHDASDIAVAPSSSTTISLSTSIANDGWALRTGNGSFNPVTNEYTFDGVETSAVFELSKFTAVSAIDIDVSDGSATDLDGNAIEDDPIDFVDSAFRFYADGVHNSIATQISGKPSNTAPNNQSITLRAVQTNTNTGACEAVLMNSQVVDMTLQCADPNSCQRPIYIGSTAVNGATPVALDFGDNTQAFAELSLNYPDAGAIQISAQQTLPSGVVLSGSSNTFVVRPFGFDVDISGNPAATNATGPVFTAAGTPFTVTASAALWSAADDSDNNGIPDNHDDSDPAIFADLSDNSVMLGGTTYTGAPNFGQEGESLSLNSALDQPSGGFNPGLALSSQINSFTSGVGSTSSRFDEVGIIEISASINSSDYLGIGATETARMISKSGYVGRFIPAAFDVAVLNPGALDDVCTAATPFTYIGQDFGYLTTPIIQVSALNALSPAGVTTNYRDSFVKLDANSVTVVATEDSTINGTDGNPLLVSYNPATMSLAANNNGTVDYTFGNDMYRYGDSVTTNAYIKLPNSEVGEFTADIEPEITEIDDGEVTLTTVSQTVDLAGNTQRFGRIRMNNAHGSELLNLQMPVFTEYFTGSFYTPNTDDFCTIFDTLDISPITDNLSTPGASTISVTNPVTQAGDIGITLSAPGAGITGQIDLGSLLDGVVNDNKWLRYDWDNDGQFNNDPSATATFGIFSGDEVNIYIQQIYQ